MKFLKYLNIFLKMNEPNEDMFLYYNENKEKIINQIAEYINKYKL